MIGIRQILDFSGSLMPGIINHLWQSTVVAVLAAVLVLTLRRERASIRYAIWLTASIKFLFPFALIVMLSRHVWSGHPTVLQPVASSVIQYVGAPALPSSIFSLERSQNIPTHMEPAGLLALVWFAGFTFVLGRWLWSWLRIRKLAADAMILDNGLALDVLRELESHTKASHALRIVTVDSEIEPGIVGIRKPILLWPNEISAYLDHQQVRAILGHELEHLRRRDNFTAALHMIVEAVFWFHPLAWFIGHQLNKERERACDEAVLQQGNDAHVYAESILKVCSHCIGLPIACVSGITGADLKKRIAQIVLATSTRPLNMTKKVILNISAISLFVVPLAYGLVHVVSLRAQLLHVDGPKPSFDVATIKPAASTEERMSIFLNAGEFGTENTTARRLVLFAFNITSESQIEGLPAWTENIKFDIKTKTDEEHTAALKKLPPSQMEEQQQLMLQSLLTERFKLKAHFERKKIPVMSLVAAKGGAKLVQTPSSSTTDGSSANQKSFPKMLIHGSPGGVERLTAAIMPITSLASWLSGEAEAHNRVVIDQTGLTGKYDFELHYLSAHTTAEQAANSSEPALTTALREQLGLQLVPNVGEVEVLVVDSIERPSEN